jgi:hypothetical protein
MQFDSSIGNYEIAVAFSGTQLRAIKSSVAGSTVSVVKGQIMVSPAGTEGVMYFQISVSADGQKFKLNMTDSAPAGTVSFTQTSITCAMLGSEASMEALEDVVPSYGPDVYSGYALCAVGVSKTAIFGTAPDVVGLAAFEFAADSITVPAGNWLMSFDVTGVAVTCDIWTVDITGDGSIAAVTNAAYNAAATHGVCSYIVSTETEAVLSVSVPAWTSASATQVFIAATLPTGV